MGIKSFVKQVCTQKAVYWEYDGNDGYGGVKYKDPVVINCRWDETSETVASHNGVEFVCKAKVLVISDLKERSRVMLGTLDDIPDGQDASQIEATEEIRRMDRHPLFKSNQFDIFVMYL